MQERGLICVATTLNQALAHVWRNAIEAEGIECQVDESSVPWLEASVWVHPGNAARAWEIIQRHLPHDTPPSGRRHQGVPG
jgi:hypothetical protein